MFNESDPIARAYDQLAYDYEHSVDINNFYNTDYERPAMIALLPADLSGVRVLDAGCAAGWYTEQLLGIGAEVTALDISSEMVAATKRRVGNRATIICHSLNRPLPFADNTFDVILSSLTLHYVEDWDLTFRDFSRVLRSSGRLLFSVHHPSMDSAKFKVDDYFLTQPLRQAWSIRSQATPVEIQFYHRPLHDVINVTTRYFTLDRVVEPQPVHPLEAKSPTHYHRLMTQPYFLIVAAHAEDASRPS